MSWAVQLARFRLMAPHRGVDFLEPLLPLEFIVGCSMAAREYSTPAQFVAVGDEEEAWLLVSGWLDFLEDVVVSYSEVCRQLARPGGQGELGVDPAGRDLARLEQGLLYVRAAKALLQDREE